MSVFDQPASPQTSVLVTLDRIPFDVVLNFTWKFFLASLIVAFPIWFLVGIILMSR